MIAFTIPVRTQSANQKARGISRGARFALIDQAKKQREAARKVTPPWSEGPLIHVHIVRVSPGVMDDDAVPAACKHIRDGVADKLRIDDGSPLIRFTYAQEKGEAGVKVEIRRVG